MKLFTLYLEMPDIDYSIALARLFRLALALRFLYFSGSHAADYEALIHPTLAERFAKDELPDTRVQGDFDIQRSTFR